MVYTLTAEQAAQLKDILEQRNWEMSVIPYSIFKAAGEKVSVVAYESGKLVVQGKNAQDFIEFILEPEILHTFRTLLPPEPSAEDLSPHGGIDESGKGDFFGPLVIAGVCVDEKIASALRQIGVCDSKLVTSSKKIFTLAEEIRKAAEGRFNIVLLRPETYNRLYSNIGNLNRLLAWGHARTIENLLDLVPDCPRMLSDKFGDESLIRRALMEKGRRIVLDQKVRAESDVAVAAASILARDYFLRQMSKLSETLGVELPRGGGPQVKITGRQLLEKHGPGVFESCAKLHFKTYAELLNETR
ncbi:MAG: ribonuclease HIII [Lentisphaeria bacterium]|nr:ribonuclease HIII [Lentisphaeria bacterium]